MAAIGVFGLIQIYCFFKFALAKLPANSMSNVNARTSLIFDLVYNWLTRGLFITILGAAPVALFFLTYFGFVAPFSGRFYSLYDTGTVMSSMPDHPCNKLTGYAKIHIPIIASVSEHQPTGWTSFFMVSICF